MLHTNLSAIPVHPHPDLGHASPILSVVFLFDTRSQIGKDFFLLLLQFISLDVRENNATREWVIVEGGKKNTQTDIYLHTYILERRTRKRRAEEE